MEYSEVRIIAEKGEDRTILFLFTKQYFENFPMEPGWTREMVHLMQKGYSIVREYKVNGVWQEV